MTKKELKKRIKELEDRNFDLRQEVRKHDETKKEMEELRRTLASHEAERPFLTERVRELVLRNDILTMTPEQIEVMRKIKVSQPLDDPFRSRLGR